MNDTKAQQESEIPMIEKDKYLRLAADFDNYRKQTDKKIEDAIEFGKRVVIEDVAGALDGFDAALGQHKSEVDNEWREGLAQAMKELFRVMHKLGVKKIETRGSLFIPALMEAVQMKPPDSPEQSGIVAQEVRAGYTLNGKVIRPSRVIVYE